MVENLWAPLNLHEAKMFSKTTTILSFHFFGSLLHNSSEDFHSTEYYVELRKSQKWKQISY